MFIRGNHATLPNPQSPSKAQPSHAIPIPANPLIPISVPQNPGHPASPPRTILQSKMLTEKQETASRANGAKSRGPVTPRRLISGKNLLHHGILARAVILDTENKDRFH